MDINKLLIEGKVIILTDKKLNKDFYLLLFPQNKDVAVLLEKDNINNCIFLDFTLLKDYDYSIYYKNLKVVDIGEDKMRNLILSIALLKMGRE